MRGPIDQVDLRTDILTEKGERERRVGENSRVVAGSFHGLPPQRARGLSGTGRGDRRGLFAGVLARTHASGPTLRRGADARA